MRKKGAVYGLRCRGITWALDTVLIGAILGAGVFLATPETIFLAPLVSTFFHDTPRASG